MDKEQTPTIAIFGHTGMVGSTIYKYYSQKGYKVTGYSRSNQDPDFSEILPEADYVFVCVPTPFNWQSGEYDLSAVEDVLGKLFKTNANQVVILKSTVPPGTTERLQRENPNINLVFNPEFLSEATAYEDFANADRQLVGYTDKSFIYATDVLHFLPNTPYDVIMPATEAEITKYVNNFHGALMVIFANLIFDICQKTGANYEIVKKASQASKWVGSPMGRMYWDVMHKGFRGYGGKCFPKDMNIFLDWVKGQGLSCEILEAMVNANRRILKDQGLTEEEVEKVSNRITE